MTSSPAATSLRDRILSGTAVGTFLGIPSATSAEIVARAGWDVVCVDAEHGALGLETIDAMIRGAEAAGVPSIVRVPEVGPEIARVLDLDAAGVLVPRIETAHEAAEVVRRARFAPIGARGAGPGRASGYGTRIADYVATANDRVVVAVQIETVAGLENVAEIAAVPGLDALFVGPVDLSASLGAPIGSDEHTAAMQRVFDVAEAAGLARAAYCGSAEALARTRAQTHLGLVLMGSDLSMLAQASAETARTAGVGGGQAAATPETVPASSPEPDTQY